LEVYLQTSFVNNHCTYFPFQSFHCVYYLFNSFQSPLFLCCLIMFMFLYYSCYCSGNVFFVFWVVLCSCVKIILQWLLDTGHCSSNDEWQIFMKWYWGDLLEWGYLDKLMEVEFIFLTMGTILIMIYDTFVNCNWVDTRWQWYSTHLHTTIHRTTQITTEQHI
jgi:hypothetical protein